jgi:hypothetical protein
VEETESNRLGSGQEVIMSSEFAKWCETDGVITFTLTSDGTAGPEWVTRIRRNGCRVTNRAERLMHSLDFRPTIGVTYEVSVIRGTTFSTKDRTTQNIRAEAMRHGLVTPNPELVCLVRVNFTDEDLTAMGLGWIVVMHEPMTDSDGHPSLLECCSRSGGRLLDAYRDHPNYRWHHECGFAFVTAQVGA